jgi:hypothetical protein
MKLHTAIIEHKHGTNTYASLTEEGIRKEVADYCREWWSDFDGLADVKVSEDDQEVIDLYFDGENAGTYESLTYGETDLELPGSPFKVLSKKEADEKMELEYIETESGFHIGLDATYMDQVEDFKIVLPTGEVIDTNDIK